MKVREELDLAIAHYRSGGTLKESADLMSVSTPTARRWFVESGVEIRSAGRKLKVLCQKDKHQIRMHYGSGQTLTEVAGVMSLSIGTVKRLLLVEGVRLRTAKEAQALRKDRGVVSDKVKIVLKARKDGATWAEAGALIGVSRQRAHRIGKEHPTLFA